MNKNILVLAYLGDAVYELLVREYLVKKSDLKVDELQSIATKYVSAKGQAKIVEYLINNNILSNDELDMIKKGRNYKRTSHPKNTDILTYKYSTGFETMIGYLYLNNKNERIKEIFSVIERM